MELVIGWIRVHEHEDGNVGSFLDFFDSIKSKYLENPNSLIFKREIVNGGHCIAIMNYRNHGVFFNDAYSVFKNAEKNLNSSFGILRVWDDEKEFNKFDVFRLAKGKLELVEDSILSPCIEKLGRDIVL